MFTNREKQLNSLSNCLNNVITKPQICAFDLGNKTISALREKGFNITSASVGTPIHVPNKLIGDYHKCLPNHDIPSNLHEYDVIIMDMSPKKPIQYKEDLYKEESNNVSSYLMSRYPQTLFNPRPFISSKIADRFGPDSIMVIFGSKAEKSEYNILEVHGEGYRIKDREIYSNYSYYRNMPDNNNKTGNEMEIVTNRVNIRNMLQKYLKNMHYEIVFQHPGEWNILHQNLVVRENFEPLLKNKTGEIVSYLDYEKGMVFLLPQIEDKTEILCCLLEEILPDLMPSKFPFSTQFAWLKEKTYWLPNQEKLESTKQIIEKEYEERIKEVNEELKSNYEKYSFLHSLITETGDSLVDAVVQFLEWLGFSNIIKMDDKIEITKEEDIQIETEEGLLVIEVKGIGGTSKDSECNQITKIKYRRSKERNKFDVFGLYIVNHQRYLSPFLRKNPPFSENQILDALNEERGLLTTWELFKSYFLVENGLTTKDNIRRKLLDYGLINLSPTNLEFIGQAEEVLKQGRVFILNLQNTKLLTGETLVIEKDGTYRIVNILSLQSNDIDVDEVQNGEVGIQIDVTIEKKSKVFKKVK